ncbi:MAG: response regulator [Bdellovibrionota bacterium]
MTNFRLKEFAKRIFEDHPSLAAAGCAVLALVIEFLFYRFFGFTLLLALSVAITVTGWLSGWKGSALVTAFATAFTLYIFNTPESFTNTSQQFAAVVALILSGVLISYLFNFIHRRFHELQNEIERGEAALERSQQSNQLKRDFIANMSHQVRVPLSAVLGFAEVLANETLTKEERESYVERLKANAASLTHLVTDILDVTEIEADHFTANRKKMLLKNFVHDAYASFSPLAVEKGLKLQFQLRGALPTYIESDGEQLTQVLKHVLGNAIRFSNDGLIKITVSSSKTANRRREVAFIINDQGPGIPSEIKRRLFKSEAIAAPGEVQKSKSHLGSGLGLVVARKLARALGGDVKLAKSNQRGTTMVVTIDGGSADEAQDFFDQLTLASPDTPLSPTDPHCLDGVRVLIVDDSPDSAVLVSRMLKGVGVHVEIANCALDGIEKAMKGSPDVVLMDIQMPEIDGNEATRRLRGLGFSKPIVALSAHVMKEDQKEALNAGVNEFLMKPVSRRALIEQIGRYIRKKPSAYVSLNPQPAY